MPLSDDIKDLIEHDTSEAQSLLRDLTTVLPKSVEAHLLLATSYLRRLEFGPAIAAYRAVVALDPKNDEALRSIGFCLLASGDIEASLTAYRQAFASTSSASSMRIIALLQHRQGRVKEAIADYARLIANAQATSPEVPVALQGLAAALRDAGRPLESDHHLQTLLDRRRREPIFIDSHLVTRNNSEDFHEWSGYADKARLAQALTRRLAVDPGGRAPETFVLPQDRAALTTFAARPDAPALYIVKPIRGSGGQGIRVTNDIASVLDDQDVVVQRYIDRPYLVDGRKGHCRIYGLITSADPLRAYVYADGIVRFAPEPYDPSPERVGDAAMHVTNTALHLGHPGLVISQDPAKDDEGAVWSLAGLLRRMTADGRDGAAVFGEIKTLVEWVVRMIAADGLFARQARSPARSFGPKLFGMDVLLDADGHPWLIEMQRTPAARGQPLVERVNSGMYATIFNMAHGRLIDDATPHEVVQAIRSDPAALRRRELEIETSQRGGFVPLDLSGL